MIKIGIRLSYIYFVMVFLSVNAFAETKCQLLLNNGDSLSCVLQNSGDLHDKGLIIEANIPKQEKKYSLFMDKHLI